MSIRSDEISKIIGVIDDIDHLGNRRVRSVGELMENQLRETATRALKEALPKVREELGRIGHATQAQALETKARRMGRVERVEHDPQNQSMTIVVKLD